MQLYVDNCLAHLDEMMGLKAMLMKADLFHLVSGMWKTPAERCFLWMGGFKPSEIIEFATSSKLASVRPSQSSSSSLAAAAVIPSQQQQQCVPRIISRSSLAAAALRLSQQQQHQPQFVPTIESSQTLTSLQSPGSIKTIFIYVIMIVMKISV